MKFIKDFLNWYNNYLTKLGKLITLAAIAFLIYKLFSLPWQQIKIPWFLWIFVFLIGLIVWGLEAQKWRLLLIPPPPWLMATAAVFKGLPSAFISPARLGEYLFRTLPNYSLWQCSKATLLSNFAQTSITWLAFLSVYFYPALLLFPILIAILYKHFSLQGIQVFFISLLRYVVFLFSMAFLVFYFYPKGSFLALCQAIISAYALRNLLPTTPLQGIGVRESLFLLFLTPLNIPAQWIIIASLINYIGQHCIPVIIGSLLWWYSGQQQPSSYFTTSSAS